MYPRKLWLQKERFYLLRQSITAVARSNLLLYFLQQFVSYLINAHQYSAEFADVYYCRTDYGFRPVSTTRPTVSLHRRRTLLQV